MGKKDNGLLERLVNELAAHNRITAICIARDNLDCWGKTQEEMVKDMKTSTERIIEWGYSTDSQFPIEAPRFGTVNVTLSEKKSLK